MNLDYKKLFVFAFVVLCNFPVQAVDWPSRSVIGVIGASYADCDAPLDSPLQGVGYAGCSFEGLAVKLLKHEELDESGFTVQSVALGGGMSYDVPGTGWKGFASQYQHLLARTFWFDGVNRLKYLVISIPNDCLHSVPCTEQDMLDGLIANIKQVAASAHAAGTTVIVNGYPRWEDLDLAIIAGVFGLSNVIDEAGYNTLSALHEQELSGLPGVLYLRPWDEMFVTIDGLHPVDASVRNAARHIADAILANEDQD